MLRKLNQCYRCLLSPHAYLQSTLNCISNNHPLTIEKSLHWTNIYSQSLIKLRQVRWAAKTTPGARFAWWEFVFQQSTVSTRNSVALSQNIGCSQPELWHDGNWVPLVGQGESMFYWPLNHGGGFHVLTQWSISTIRYRWHLTSDNKLTSRDRAKHGNSAGSHRWLHKMTLKGSNARM